MPHEFIRPLEIISHEPKDGRKEASREELARGVCQLGNYEAILDAFSQEEHAGLFEEAIERTKKQSEKTLGEASRLLVDGDWEMLTILELFDHETFEHCLRTYQIAHQKINIINI